MKHLEFRVSSGYETLRLMLAYGITWHGVADSQKARETLDSA